MNAPRSPAPETGPPHRVLHVLDHSLPTQTGYTYRTLSILRAQRLLGWETFHLTSPKQAGSPVLEESVDGWHFFRTPGRPVWPDMPGWRDLGAAHATLRRLDELVRRLRPTVIHAHSPLLNGYPALWVGWRHRLPVIYEVRAFWEDAAVDQGTAKVGDARYQLTRTLETGLMRRADAVVAICDGLRRDIEARGLAVDKLTVVPNVVDSDSLTRSNHSNSQLRQRFALGHDAFVLGFIGSFYHYEGLEFLIREVAPLFRSRPNLRLLLIGGGPAESDLRAEVEALRLSGQIIFAGRVPHRDIAACYDLIDVLVYPRLPLRLTELVTPLKPLEAMAAGRIVVASDVGGHRELIQDRRNGFLFPAGNGNALRSTLESVMRDRSDLRSIGENARADVSLHRSIERMARDYATAYRGIATRAGAQLAAVHAKS